MSMCRELKDGAEMAAVKEQFERHRMGDEHYERMLQMGRRLARWRDIKEHPAAAEVDLAGHDWAVVEDPRFYTGRGTASAKM
jgi:hypothetical protein|eukprot:COSAG06_NODE_26989_length_603_cov_1.283730_1_plen_82_part_00